MRLNPKSASFIALVALVVSAAAQQTTPAAPPPAPGGPRITLDDAIKLALDHSPTLRATRTQIAQSQAQEVTANFRPNPVLSWDSQFIPIFNPSQFSGDTLNQLQQFDVG